MSTPLIIARKCTTCGRINDLTKVRCGNCKGTTFTTVETKPTGTLLSYTILTALPKRLGDKKSQAFGIIQLQEGWNLLAALEDGTTYAVGNQVEGEHVAVSRNDDGTQAYGWRFRKVARAGQKVGKVAKSAPLSEKGKQRKEHFLTSSGLSLKPVYSPGDLGENLAGTLGSPGEFPFTRGVYPTMYRGQLWTMRQYAGFASARLTNDRFKYLLAQGQKGLSVAFDLPTQMGYDSDDPHASGEVGRVGVSVNSLADLELVFKDIPLDQVSVSFTINAPAAVILAMFVAVGKKQGVAPGKLRGTVQNDILKEYAARGAYIFSPTNGMRLCADIIEYCAKEMPTFNPISISGYHMREAGCNAAQEIAFTIANGIEYMRAVLARGIAVDDFAPRLSFFFCAQNNFLEEVAKFRAARRLWARIVRTRFNAKNLQSCMLRFHTQTAGVSLTAQQPNNNVIRVTTQALSAILGGTQSLHTNSRDEALSIPSEESVLLALRTQQILGHETGVADVVDPLGGSFCIEALTDALETQAQKLLEKVEKAGGATKAIQQGFIQREILENAYQMQRDIEKGATVVIGVNQFADKAGEKLRPFKFDENASKETLSFLNAARGKRNQTDVENCLAKVRTAASGGANLVPIILQAVESYATIGEICGVLRDVFGEFKVESQL